MIDQTERADRKGRKGTLFREEMEQSYSEATSGARDGKENVSKDPHMRGRENKRAWKARNHPAGGK